MQGKITIELTRRGGTRETGSDLPDLGHDAYWFAKQMRELVWQSKSGEQVRMADYYDATSISVNSASEPLVKPAEGMAPSGER